MVRMRGRDAEGFEGSREIKQRDALIRNDGHTDGLAGWHLASLAGFQGIFVTFANGCQS
jgi:hypothetical protein